MRSNKWFLVTSISLCLVFALTGCSKDDDEQPTPSSNNPPPNTNATFPFLKAGNQLQYSFQSIFITDTAFSVNFTADGNAFKNTQTFLPSASVGITWLKECTGNLALSGSSASVDCANIFFKGNRVVGDSWTFTTSSGNTATHAVVAKNVSVTVPAGTFICDKMTYSTVGGFNTDTLYFNNDVSFVKYEGLIGNYQLKSKNF